MSHDTPKLHPIRADERYLKPQVLPSNLLRALSNRERVYVGGKPYRVEAIGFSEDGQIIGKLEVIDAADMV